MPVIVVPDALYEYPELVADLEAYLNRTDYTSRIPTFLRLTEARLNRLLDDPNMEIRVTTTGTGQYTELPNDFKRMIGVTTGGVPLEQVSGAAITSYPQTVTGAPRQYAIVDGAITFAPINAAANVSMLYERRIPPLTESNPTNWLLRLAPDIYLCGCLLQANVYGWQDERVPLFKAAFDEAIEELRIEGDRRRWGSAPLAPRIGRT